MKCSEGSSSKEGKVWIPNDGLKHAQHKRVLHGGGLLNGPEHGHCFPDAALAEGGTYHILLVICASRDGEVGREAGMQLTFREFVIVRFP